MTPTSEMTQCVVMSRAQALAAWVGPGKQVTAKGVLRRADVGPATAAIGVPDPGWVRTAADLAALHRPWVAAQASGLLSLDFDRATAAAPVDRDPAETWLLALRGVLRAESDDERRIGAAVLCRLVLDVLQRRSAWTADVLDDAVHQELERSDYSEADAAYQAFSHGVRPIPAAVELLTEFGAVAADGMTVTPLGRWAYARLAEPILPAEPPDTSHEADQLCQLKVELRHARPPVWRRVLVPSNAGLGLLHRIVQVVLAWDDDHLHVFTADGIHYADPYHELDDCADEDTIPLATVLPQRGASIRYRYDLGDCWDHTITVEKIVEGDGGITYPCCVGGRGDAPVEDWIPGSPQVIPFDVDLINRKLSALSESGASAEQHLHLVVARGVDDLEPGGRVGQ